MTGLDRCMRHVNSKGFIGSWYTDVSFPGVGSGE